MSEANKDVADFTITRVKSPTLIKRVLTVPALWNVITEDNSVAREDYEPLITDDMYYLLIARGKEVIGMFVVHPLTATVCVGHANILPKYWGEREQNAAIGKAAIQWVWDNTEFHKIVTTVPVIYKHVLAYTQRIGMKREGMMRKSHLKRGELHDQYYMGISREE